MEIKCKTSDDLLKYGGQLVRSRLYKINCYLAVDNSCRRRKIAGNILHVKLINKESYDLSFFLLPYETPYGTYMASSEKLFTDRDEAVAYSEYLNGN